MNKPKPIGEELDVARALLWNPRLLPTKTPMSDVAFEAQRKVIRDEDGGIDGFKNRKPWPFMVVMAILDEMEAAGWSEGLIESFREKFYREGIE